MRAGRIAGNAIVFGRADVDVRRHAVASNRRRQQLGLRGVLCGHGERASGPPRRAAPPAGCVARDTGRPAASNSLTAAKTWFADGSRM